MMGRSQNAKGRGESAERRLAPSALVKHLALRVKVGQVGGVLHVRVGEMRRRGRSEASRGRALRASPQDKGKQEVKTTVKG